MWQEFWNEEDGFGTVEMILLIAALVAVALIFRGQITGFIEKTGKDVFENASEGAK